MEPAAEEDGGGAAAAEPLVETGATTAAGAAADLTGIRPCCCCCCSGGRDIFSDNEFGLAACWAAAEFVDGGDDEPFMLLNLGSELAACIAKPRMQ